MEKPIARLVYSLVHTTIAYAELGRIEHRQRFLDNTLGTNRAQRSSHRGRVANELRTELTLLTLPLKCHIREIKLTQFGWDI